MSRLTHPTPSRFALCALLLCACARAALAASSSLPMDYYLQRGLIPAPPPAAASAKSKSYATDPLTPCTEDHILNTSGSFSVDLRQVDGVVNERIILENCGTVPILDPWVSVNGKRNWFDAASMVAEAVGSETTPEKRAFRIWRFVRDNRFHWYPADIGSEVHDPAKLINVYGYGFCDDAALVTEALWRTAGFTQTRVWGLGGHVVPEVYYDGAWHVFDADLEVFYPTADRLSVAGVRDCMYKAALVTPISGATVAGIYSSGDDNTIYASHGAVTHAMSFFLRPGERLSRHWTNWGKCRLSQDASPPPIYGNGRLSYAPRLNDPAALAELGASNLAWVPGDTPAVRRPDPTAPGVLTVCMRAPYVFVGGSITVKLQAPTDSDRLKLEFSLDGSEWTVLGRCAGPLADYWSYTLDDQIAPPGDPACYQYWLRLTLAGPTAELGLEDLFSVGEIQCAPLALPALEPATDNRVSVAFGAEPGAALRVTQEFQALKGVAPDSAITLLPPVLGKSGAQSDSLFSWAFSSPVLDGYEALISRDSEGVLPASPVLWRWCGAASSWVADDQWLLPNRPYYWRVRYRDQFGAWRPWSPSAAFTLKPPPAAARDWARYK